MKSLIGQAIPNPLFNLSSLFLRRMPMPAVRHQLGQAGRNLIIADYPGQFLEQIHFLPQIKTI